jgi:hypothetical protein
MNSLAQRLSNPLANTNITLFSPLQGNILTIFDSLKSTLGMFLFEKSSEWDTENTDETQNSIQKGKILFKNENINNQCNKFPF